MPGDLRFDPLKLKPEDPAEFRLMQEKELSLKQKVEQQELTIKQVQQTVKENQQALKAVQAEIDKERSSGKSVWETVGISTVPYRDPFHTGLSKRTPTGARRAACRCAV